MEGESNQSKKKNSNPNKLSLIAQNKARLKSQKKQQEPQEEQTQVQEIVDDTKNKEQQVEFHNCSFLNYEPQPIVSIAYKTEDKLLAVARYSSCLDIYRYPQFNLVKRYQFDRDLEIKNILFLQDKKQLNTRLLITYQNGYISELLINLSVKPKYTYNINSNGIWNTKLNNNNISAFGCEDGTIRLYNLQDPFSTIPQFLRVLKSFKQRCLSVEWLNEKYLYSGYENNLIRKFEISTGNVVQLINLPIANKQFSTNKPWCLQIVENQQENGILAVGTSSGSVYLYETQFGTQLKEFQFLEGDVLTIARHPTSSTIYASGSDSRIICIQKVEGGDNSNTTTTNNITQDNWVLTSKERGQINDVNSLLCLSNNTLISGGLSTDLCLYTLQNQGFRERKLTNQKEPEKLRHITDIPDPKQSVSFAKKKEILLFIKNFSLELWELTASIQDYTFLLRLDLQDNSSITCATINSDGTYITYSTNQASFIYKFDRRALKLEKVFEFEVAQGIFFGNHVNELYYISLNGTLKSIKLKNYRIKVIVNLQEKLKKEINQSNNMQVEQESEQEQEEQLQRDIIVTDYQISSNDKYIVLGSKFTNKIYLITFDRENDNNTQQYQIIVIPTIQYGVTYSTICLSPDNSKLIVVLENNKFSIYDLTSAQILKWSKNNLNKFPKNYILRYTRITGVVFPFRNSDKFILYTPYYYIPIDIKKPLPKQSHILKRKGQNLTKEQKNLAIIYFSQPVLKLETFTKQPHAIAGFSIDWNYIAQNLPEPLYTKHYGN